MTQDWASSSRNPKGTGLPEGGPFMKRGCMEGRDQALDVWGEFACFTRPELKVERFSYPVPTPSAARGIYDAIYCNRHEFRWQVTAIEVLKPKRREFGGEAARPGEAVRFVALRRNEVREKINVDEVEKKWMNGEPPTPIYADLTEEVLGTDRKGRVQRQTMALRDVHYRLHAVIRPYDGFEGKQNGYENEFRRRAARGKCIYQPYFGCREFPAYFELVEVGMPPAEREKLDLDIGWMLYDVFDLAEKVPDEEVGQTKPRVSLFHASGDENGVRGGVLKVPPYESDSVHKVPKEGDHA